MSDEHSIRLLSPYGLRPHEAIVWPNALLVLVGLWWSRAIKQPLLVDKNTGIILDGHHRWWASKRLGLALVPCYCVDYLNDGAIVCEQWRPEVPVDKEAVLAMARGGRTFPPKTSKHYYQLPPHETYPFRVLR